METVDTAISELESSVEYIAMSVDEKVQAASNLLESLAEVDEDLGYALIQTDSIVYKESVYQFEFQYACGVNFVWQIYTEPGD